MLYRGARPTERHLIEAAALHTATTPAPPQFLWKPPQLSMWGNDTFGDCVTAEECFALACSKPEVLIGYAKAVKWARQRWLLNGAGIWEVLTIRQTQPIYNGAEAYLDGPFKFVNYNDRATLSHAIAQGPVKVGVAASQLQSVVEGNGIQNGWVATGFTKDTNLDHCPALCGYGPLLWLAGQLGAPPPNQADAAKFMYAMFTWSTIGIIDEPSLLAIIGESWLRSPTTIVKPNPVPVQPPAVKKRTWLR